MLPQTSMQLREYEMALAHTPVLLDELLELLRPARGEMAIDCTFGAGGHAEAVAAALGAKGRLIAVDRDPSVAEYFRDVARAAPCACELYHGNFADVLAERETASVDIVYMDLGVSSMQLDRRERGFSYAYDAPLDMRMDPELEVTAADLVNTLPEDELTEHLPPLRRGAVRPQHRPRHRAGAQEDAADDDQRAGRDRQAHHPDAGPLRRRQPGAPRLPGAAHRRQRRAGLAGPRPRRGLPRAAPRRPPRGDQLPLARRPHGQGLLQGPRRRLHLPARPAAVRVRPRADPARADAPPVTPRAAEVESPTRAASPPSSASP